ncbi:hypothetical protein PHMEG_00035037 [Phytophthora megakarya]|uniref:PiggyBac transposable element-derived protein domain-containing protein n=1 Tax=Phytophthora megakarya TaxID=4795 RepID=A0A225UPU1_9STRA|nr:hypothetical protein PHMEG_00035037 [Phytophthora megakarya]
MRLVVVDRFYTSVALAIQLLLMGFYCVGTIMTNRLGYCKQVKEKKKTRPATITRGSCKISQSKLVPDMKAISWWDSRPVHFLCTGGSTEIDRVTRQDGAEEVEVPCPRSLVLGLIDLAIVNSYIVHKAYHKHKNSKPLTHVKFMIKLHLQLTQLQPTDMYEGNTFGAQVPSSTPTYELLPVGARQQSQHSARLVDEWRNADTQPKRRQRACKVCSTLRTDTQRAPTTSYYCADCSTVGPIFLCQRARRKVRDVAMTCWDIWHQEWANGKMIHVENAKSIRVRRKVNVGSPGTPSTPGTPAASKRRRTSP